MDFQDWQGVVEQIWVAPSKGAVPIAVGEVEAVAGMGLKGDRFFKRSNTRNPARQLTLIEREVLDTVATQQGVDLRDGRHRRQIVVSGVRLNDLVGVEFMVGGVRVRGIEWCEPCRRMARLAGEPKAIKAFVHRGGLNAQILSDGIISVDDLVRKVPGAFSSGWNG
jgi:MOSC domain-containing protein YiiM